MTISKIKCEKCGYEGEYNSEIYEGLCEDCALPIKKIGEEINRIKNKDTQTTPEYYAELFIKIMEFGGLDLFEIKRYFKYIFEIIINKNERGK